MAPPLDNQERDHIIQLLHAGHSYAHIANEVGRGTSTVSRIAQQIGHRAGQTNVARAHEARSAYSAERRAAIAARLTEEADRFIDDLHGRYLAYNFGGKDNTYEEHLLEEPPVEAKRALMQSAREAMRTVLDIDRHDNKADDDLAAVDRWLHDIVSGAG